MLSTITPYELIKSVYLKIILLKVIVENMFIDTYTKKSYPVPLPLSFPNWKTSIL